MTSIELQLDDDLVTVLDQLHQPLQQEARELIVFELYRRE